MANTSKPRKRRTNPTKKVVRKTSRTKPTTPPRPASKLDQMVAKLRTTRGATLADLMALTGWQQHSVRGALAGALKQRGLAITSTKTGPERIYRIEAR